MAKTKNTEKSVDQKGPTTDEKKAGSVGESTPEEMKTEATAEEEAGDQPEELTTVGGATASTDDNKIKPRGEREQTVAAAGLNAAIAAQYASAGYGSNNLFEPGGAAANNQGNVLEALFATEEFKGFFNTDVDAERALALIKGIDPAALGVTIL